MLRAAAAGLSLVLLWSAASAQAADKRRRPNKKSTVAVFPAVPEGGPDKSLVEALDRTLAAAIAQSGLDSLGSSTLQKRLKTPPLAAARRCGGEVACLAKLGRTAKVDEVVFGVAKSAGAAGVEASLAVLPIAKETPRRGSFVYKDQATLDAGLAGVWQTLFNLDAPASLTPTPSLEGLAALPLVPLESPGGSDAPSGGDLELVPLARVEPEPSAPKSANGALDKERRTDKAVTFDTPPSVSRRAQPPGLIRWLGYTGAGLAAVGLGVSVYAALEYRKHVDLVDSVNADRKLPLNDRASQAEAERIDDEASTHFQRSIYLGFGVGVPLVAIGAGLIAWDLLEDVDLETSALPLPGGAMGTVRLSF